MKDFLHALVVLFLAAGTTAELVAREPREEVSWVDELGTRETLSGDWGGARSYLRDRGLSIELIYTADVVSNLAGGARRAAEVLGNVDLLLTFDTEPLLEWPGGELFLYGLGNHGGDPSANIGDIQVVDNIEAFDTWKLYEAWYQQKAFGDRVAILGGLYDLNSEFDVVPAADLLLNSSFGVGADLGSSGKNGPSIFPTTSLAARVELRPVDSFYARAAVFDGVPGDVDQSRGTQVILRSDDGLLLAAEVGFESDSDGEDEIDRAAETHPRRESHPHFAGFRKLAIGAWGYTTEFEDFFRTRPDGSALTRSGAYGVYALGEHRLWHEAGRPAEGLTAFIRIGCASEHTNPIDAYLGGGWVYRGLFPGRESDRLALAAAAAHLSADYREAVRRAGSVLDSWEVAIECTYSAELAPYLIVQPDFQYVVNPSGGGDLDDGVVLGVRVVLSF